MIYEYICSILLILFGVFFYKMAIVEEGENPYPRRREAKVYDSQPVAPEDFIFRRVNEIVDGNYASINAPRSDEYVINNRNLKLHVRSFWPTSEAVAVIVSLHGFASHISRPTHLYIGKEMNKKGVAYITIDFHGHGYSEGLRGLVSNPNDLIDDVLSVLLAIYSSSGIETETFNLEKTARSNMPLFLMGHSMGGATATLVSNLLSRVDSDEVHTRFSISKKEEISRIATNFKGAILFCPAFLVVDLPSWVISFADRWVAPLFASTIMPGGSSNIEDNRLIWTDDAYIDYIVGDGYPRNPAGLSWGLNPRVKTATSILSLGDRARSTAENTTYSFIIFQDSKEQILKIQGVELFIAKAKSPKKQFIEVEGGRHDLIANKLGALTSQTISWILSELS